MLDLADVKEVTNNLGDWACFGDNVPGSLPEAGTPQEVEDYVRKHYVEKLYV